MLRVPRHFIRMVEFPGSLFCVLKTESCAAPVKRILLAAAAVILFLEIYRADGASINWCFFGDFSPPKVTKAFKELTYKYEDLRKESQPWRNCSREHLRWPKASLDNIWDKREALAMKLDLVISVLRNHSQTVSAKIVKPVLEEYLMPLQGRLANCIKHKPSDHRASSHLQEFKEKLQTFNTTNVQPSSRSRPQIPSFAASLDHKRPGTRMPASFRICEVSTPACKAFASSLPHPDQDAIQMQFSSGKRKAILPKEEKNERLQILTELYCRK
ncbi:Apolipoprotein M [Podarcis lilfordi]|uniref:Apolipoprotein M n=1 Tax=Podarcis lilfordi TaxID=74358 RepID=A0AA35PDG4_9SAUR|nr:Apolipoprotein M [Podarcis lilfordi]